MIAVVGGIAVAHWCHDYFLYVMIVQRLLMVVDIICWMSEVCEPMTISMICNLAMHSFLKCLPVVVLFRCCYNGVAIQIYQNKTTATMYLLLVSCLMFSGSKSSSE